MSMLVPPQMMNTMVPASHDAGEPTAQAFTEAFYADPVRRYMLPVFSDRRSDWPTHPHATRDSLHEHDMWVAEGLTHRYPTKVLAELLPTCPQYCGHCTRMDIVGNSTPQVAKLKFDLKPVARQDQMIDYLRRSPGVRDVVVSGGDVANLPWKSLEAYVARLLEVDNIRDIRLATKALMGLPAALAPGRSGRRNDPARGHGPRARRLARHPHPRQHGAVGDPSGRRGLAGDDGRGRARRAQPGRADAWRQRRRRAAARPVLRAPRRGRDHALLLLHVRHDPVQSSTGGSASSTRSTCSTRSWATCPASRPPASCATCRSSASAGCTSSHSYDEVHGVSHWTKNYRTWIEVADDDATVRTYEYYDPIDTLPAGGPGAGGPSTGWSRSSGRSPTLLLRQPRPDWPPRAPHTARRRRPTLVRGRQHDGGPGARRWPSLGSRPAGPRAPRARPPGP